MDDVRKASRDRVDVDSGRRVILRSRGRVRFLASEDVDWIEAADNYVRVHSSGTIHVARETLTALEKRLDRRRFVRIHRRSVVNLGAVVAVRPLPEGAPGIELRSGDTLRVGRKYRAHVRQIGEALKTSTALEPGPSRAGG